MSMTPQSWARDLLTKLGYPVTRNNMSSVLAWEYQEGGHFANAARFNPLNTTLGHARFGSINSVGVAAYPDYETGLRETIATIELAPYARVRHALSTSASPLTTAAAIKASPWGTWHGSSVAPVVKRAQAQVRAHPAWYQHGSGKPPGSAHKRPTHGSRGHSRSGAAQRLVVYPSELASVVASTNRHAEVAQHVVRGMTRHAAELTALAGGEWAVPDQARFERARHGLDEALAGKSGARVIAQGLTDVSTWVASFRSQILAADGPGASTGLSRSPGGGSPGRGAPGGRTTRPIGSGRPATPIRHHASTRTARIHKMLSLAGKQHADDGGSNHTKYGAWFGTNGVAWCAQFVSWVFAHSGNRLPSLDGPAGKGFQSCPDAIRYAGAHGQLHHRPRVGDIFLLKNGEHTGIVSRVFPDGHFHTIEGNAGAGDRHVVHGLRNGSADAHRNGYYFWTAIRP
jgi:hypothetical protein